MPNPIESCHPSADLFARPIIMIGSGRSGSTLFVRALNDHPEIQFFAETHFVVARLWANVWDNRSWLRSQQKLRCEFEPGGDEPFEIPPDALSAARGRAARGVRALFGELMQVDRTKAAWGFKEIWNGNHAVARVPWSVYQTVFPDTRWVHLVRDPFAFARSSARWNGAPLTMSLLREELQHWTHVIAWSRLLQDQPRYHELRYEDLAADPKASLTPVLASVGLSWHPSCGQAFERRIKASRGSSRPAARTLPRAQLEQMIGDTPGLAALMQEFGYAPPAGFEIEPEIPGALGRRLRKAVKRTLRLRLPSSAQPGMRARQSRA